MATKKHLPLNSSSSSSSSSSSFVVFLVCNLLLSHAVIAKHPISDTEVRQKKNECYADIERITDPGDKIHTSIDWGLWGWKCKSSMIAKENCALHCLAPPCYELIYASDPLEEGEKDLVRSQEFKYCMHKLSLGESLEGIKGSFEY